ncbi:MAG TPA: hypothetical protein VGL77_21480, partial [Armatimonadota bacterium]
RITANGTNSVTVSPNWTVAPVAGSQYVITDFYSDAVLVKDNNLFQNHRGIYFWSGGSFDIAVVNNRLVDSGEILLHTYLKKDRIVTTGVPAGVWLGMQELAVRAQITDNLVQNLTGKFPASVAVMEQQRVNTGSAVYAINPNTTYNTVIRRNRVEASTPNAASTTGECPWTDGYFNYTRIAVGSSNALPPSQDDTNNNILGTIFENNIAKNTDHDYYLGTGVQQTIIKAGAGTNSAATLISDTQGAAPATHASTGTVAANAPYTNTVFNYDSDETELFRDNFQANGGNDGWALGTGTTIAQVSGTYVWYPTVTTSTSASYTLPSAVDIRKGPVTLYCRVRPTDPNSGSTGMLWFTLINSVGGTPYCEFYVKPGSTGTFKGTGGTLVPTGITPFIDNTSFRDFRLTATLNTDGSTFSMRADYWNGTQWINIGTDATTRAINGGLFNTFKLNAAATSTPYVAAVAITQKQAQPRENFPFWYGAGEMEQFRDNFDSGNTNNWTSLGGSYAFSNGLWYPTVAAWASAAVTLPVNVDINKGPVTVYLRARTDNPTAGSSGIFWHCLLNGSNWMETDIRPGSTGSFAASGGSDPHEFASHFDNSSAYVDFRSTASKNADNTMTFTGEYYDPTLTPPWRFLDTVSTINSLPISIGTGIFSSLRLGASVTSGNWPYFTTVSITQTPN